MIILKFFIFIPFHALTVHCDIILEQIPFVPCQEHAKDTWNRC